MTALVLACGLLFASGQAKIADPLEFYKKYLDTFAKADTLKPVLPFYTKELSDIYSKAPKEGLDAYFKGHAARQKLTNLKVTKQTVDAKSAVIDLSATTGDGSAASGRVTLAKEGGEWKVADEAWVLPPPKL